MLYFCFIERLSADLLLWTMRKRFRFLKYPDVLIRNRRFHFLLIALSGLLIYSNTFHVPFQFDDEFNIFGNPLVRSRNLLAAPFQSRYLAYFSFALNYMLHGRDVSGYHAVNLVIHIVNAILVYSLVILLFRAHSTQLNVNFDHSGPSPGPADPSMIALGSALLFIIHPLQTQAVTYIVQRLASLATMFYLGSVICYIAARTDQRKTVRGVLYFLSLIFAVSAMKTKEIAFTLPFAVFIIEVMFFRGNSARRLLYLSMLFLALLIIPMSLIDFRTVLSGGFDPATAWERLTGAMDEATKLRTTMSRKVYLFTQCRVLLTYLRLVFFPVNQSIDYDYPLFPSLSGAEVLFSSGLLSVFLGLGIYLFIRSRSSRPESVFLRIASFGIFWFFLTLMVESSFIPIVDVLFEHRMYLPSAGLFITIAAAVSFWVHIGGMHRNWLNRSCFVLTAIVLVSLGILTFTRNMVWSDELTVWTDMVRKNPRSERGHNNIGYAYFRQGRMSEALEAFERSIAVNPFHLESYLNRGLVFLKTGRYEPALKDFSRVISARADLGDAYRLRGETYALTGKHEAAIDDYSRALILLPSSAEVYLLMGKSHKAVGNIQKAGDGFAAACRLGSREGCVLLQAVTSTRR